MSKTIDQKVVEMRFENAQFEKGIAQSMSSLDKLKQSLDFSGLSTDAAKELTNSLSGISTSVGNISEKFTAFGIMAATALSKVASYIVDVGMSIEQNLIEKMEKGYEKYNVMMESIQTIMYGTRNLWDDTGAQMDYVSAQIDKLNWYTDETSYNLTDMTNNIGKFVAAGVDLDDAVTAMMGISSWAAISGQKADAASRAMYNLSQAMAVGKVTVKDWMSIENANMATTEFKHTVADLAFEMGKLHETEEGWYAAYNQYGKEVIVGYDSMRDSLSAGWFDSEVLTAVLKRYGDFADHLYTYTEQTGLTATDFLKYIEEYKQKLSEGANMGEWLLSVAQEENIDNVLALGEGLRDLSSDYMELGRQAFMAGQECKTFEDVTLAIEDVVTSAWMRIFTSIFGNYEESKELWTSVYDELYTLTAEKIDNISREFKKWSELGGRQELIDALWELWGNISYILSTIKDAFEEYFPSLTVDTLLEKTSKFKEIADQLAFVDFPWAPQLTMIANAAENVAAGFNNILTNIKNIAKQAKKAWDRIFPSDNDPLWKKETAVIEGILDITEKFKNFTEEAMLSEEQLDKLERSFAGLFAILDILRMLFVAILTPLTGFKTDTDALVDPILDVTASIGDWLVALRDWIAENDIFTKAVEKVIWFFQQIPIYADKVSVALFGMHIGELFEEILNSISAAFPTIIDFFSKMFETAGGVIGFIIGLFTDFPGTMKAVDEAISASPFGTFWENLKPILESVYDIIVKIFDWLSDKGAEAIDTIINYDWAGWWAKVEENAKKVYDAVSSVIDAVFKFIRDIPSKLDKLSFDLFGKSWADVLDDIKDKIAEVIDKFKELLPKIEAGIHAVKRFFGLEDWNTEGGKHDADSPFTVWLNSLDPLQDFCDGWNDFTESDAGKAIQKVGVIAAVLGGLFLVWKCISVVKDIIKEVETFRAPVENLGPMGTLSNFVDGMIAVQNKFANYLKYAAWKLIADSVLEIAAAIAIIAILKTEDIAQAVAVLGGFMFIFLELFKVIGNTDSTKLVQTSAAFATMAGALMEISVAFAILQGMDLPTLVVAATALTAVMYAMVGAFEILGNSKIDATAIALYASAFLIMGTSIVAIALGLSILGGLDWDQLMAAGIAIGTIIGVLALAVIALDKLEVGTTTMYGFAAAMAAMGASVLMAGGGVWLFADAIEKISNIGSEGIDNIIYGITSFFSILPQLATNVGEAIVAFIQVFVDSKDTLLAGLDTMLDIIVTSLTGALPKFLEFGKQMFLGMLQAGIDCMPKIVEFLQVLFDTIVDLTIGWTPRIIDTVIFIVTELLRSMVVLTPMITSAALAILIDTLAQLAENIGTIVMLLTQILIETILGTIDGITAELPHIMESIWNFVITLINTFADGLDEHALELREAVVHLMESLWEAIKTFFGIHSPSTKFFDMAGDMIQGMIDGLKAMIEKAKEAITELADKVLTKICDFFGIKKPESQNEFLNLGKTIIQKFIDGIGKMIESAKTKIRELADAVLTKICDFFGIKKPETQNEFLNLGKTIIQKFNQGIYNMISKAKEMILNLATNVINKVKEFFGIETDTANGSFFDIAVQLINGFIQGIKDKINSAVSTIGDFCDDVIEKCKNTFGVASPSKVFMQIGRFLDEGLVVGIGDYAYRVIEASEDMANDAVDAVSSAISGIADIVDENLEDPTIKPIMDLSDVVNGTNAINDMLGSDRAFSLAADSSYDINRSIVANNAPSALDDLIATLSGTPNGDTITQNNVFNISGNDPKAIAEEVSNILQHDVERRDKVWE